MPYTSNEDLPKNVTNVLPKHGQDIFREAFNNAYQEYKDSKDRSDPSDDLELTARKVAWNVVKTTYKKRSDGNMASKRRMTQ